MLAAFPVLANILRYLFIAILQTAAFVAVSNVLESLVNYVRDALGRNGGLNESQKDDAMLEMTIEVLALIGVTVASLKSKIPVRLADRLGLKAGVSGKKALDQSTKAGIAATAKAGTLGGSSIKKYLGVVALSFAGSLPWLPGLIQQFGDQATFAPKNANDFYEGIFGIRPFNEPDAADSPGTFTGAEFAEYFVALQTAGASSISNPCKLQDLPFSKTNLTDLVRCVYGQENAAGKSTTATKLKQALAPYIRLTNGSAAPTFSSGTGSSGSSSGFVGGAVSFSGVKVYTGIVSSGVVGQGLSFVARPDDLIESQAELQEAAQNNLAAYLAALPAKIVYEVKIVASVISKDGFKQTGTTQRIQDGTYSNGTAKFKTVTNKFAVLIIYALTDKGVRSKLTQITLGPTNSAKLAVTQNYLSDLAADLPSLVIEDDDDNVSNITTPGSDNKEDEMTNEERYEVIYDPKKERWSVDDKKTGKTKYYSKRADAFKAAKQTDPGENAVGPKAGTGSGSSSSTTPKSGGSTKPTAKAGAGATTLAEWYKAQGQSLPSVSSRSKIYEGFGLGKASLYTGTAEQNTKLLNALKSK